METFLPISQKYIDGILRDDSALQALAELYFDAGLDKRPVPAPAGRTNDIVWQYWGQGIENAPRLVQTCVNSVKEHCGRKHILLDNKSIANYVDIPLVILKKFRQNIIPPAHFADFIRLLLLEKHGGTWIDATVLMTGAAPKSFFASPLFWFSASPGMFRSPLICANWFIHANGDNSFCSVLKDFLLEYWKKYDGLLHYFIFHLCVVCLQKCNDYCRDVIAQVPFYSNQPPEILQQELTRPFDAERFAEICAMTPVHKLSYRLVKPEDEATEGTLLRHVYENYGEKI